jgi:hypothetical protein
MRDLLACQRDLAGALSDARDSARAARWLAGDATLNERRLAIYRANVAAAATRALSAAYPVIRQVVGPSAFDELAGAYLRRVPSTGGDLNELGSVLADFVADGDVGQSLPYLPDLARLEWAAHRAYGAADASGFDARALAQVPAHRQATIRFGWAACTALIASPFPIVRIWHIHQPDFDGEFSVDWSAGEVALVVREGLRVAVRAVRAGDAAFVSASLDGAALGAATERALAADPDFDLARLLKQLMAASVICGFNDDIDDIDDIDDDRDG